MFAYCQNNPVAYIDPNGLCREVGALLTWIDCKSIFCPTSSAHRPHITPPAVPASSLTAIFSYGLSANANVGPTVYGVQGFITLDSQGYAALQYSVFSGVSAGPDSDKFSGGCVPFVMMTNAGNYNDLNDKGISMGASISNYAVDYVGMLDDDGKTLNYHGISISLPGVGFGGSAGNAHITGSYTGTVLATLFDWDTYRKVTQY